MNSLLCQIQSHSNAIGVPQYVVERDHAQSYILYGLSQVPKLANHMVFKGGTALRKIYFRGYRFSEDLDFSVWPVGTQLDWLSLLEQAMKITQLQLQDHGDTSLTIEPYKEKQAHPENQAAFVLRVKYPWHRQALIPIMLEISPHEQVLLEPLKRPILHNYEERITAQIFTYRLEEIAAEKIRASAQTLKRAEKKGWLKPRARDFYDLWHILRFNEEPVDWSLVSSILAQKCASKQVSISRIEDIFHERLIQEVRERWQATLGPFTSVLPEVDPLLAELKEGLTSVLRF